jgi:hypothetical protein
MATTRPVYTCIAFASRVFEDDELRHYLNLASAETVSENRFSYDLHSTQPDSLSMGDVAALTAGKVDALLFSHLRLVLLERELLASIALLPYRLAPLAQLRGPPLPRLVDGDIVLCVGVT